MAPDLNDDRLMALSAAGDQEAFGLLVARWETQVRTFLWRMTGSSEDARDLCQETFLKVLKGLPSFRGGSSLKTWIYRIAVNLCLNEIKRRKRKDDVTGSFAEQTGFGDAVDHAMGRDAVDTHTQQH